MVLKGEALGTVTRYFIKEYHARSVPNYHLLLWIQDAPVIGNNRPDDVLKFIRDKITRRIPQEESYPEQLTSSKVTTCVRNQCALNGLMLLSTTAGSTG